ncbi:MAG: glycosyltransferase [Cytophagaceae bacterium]|nr:glycosyltransferase [Cytophagaceae bacterium]
MKKYSVIVPVYNRPQEVKELLDSLRTQTYKDFELILVEDGSTEPCEYLVADYTDTFPIQYFFKPNSGPGDSRNFGMDKATGEYLIFFDSDCLIPSHYFQALTDHQALHPLDAFGGPDAAHESFSTVQKAINQSMTSFVTTGGIRGRKNQLDKFQPRSFNMGLKHEVYVQVGGFSDIHPGEDPDLSYRIMNAGFKTGLVPEAFVYHKRRIDFGKFYTQVNKFGMVRVILMKWHPERSKKLVYYLPSLFVIGCVVLLLASFWLPYTWVPMAFLTAVLWGEALIETDSFTIAFLSIFASYIQLFGYGWGFLKAQWQINLNEKDERVAFPKLFFGKK